MSEPTPERNEFFTGLTVALLLAGTTWFSVIAATFSSLWWLALPVVVAGLLWWITRPRRRDEQLAQVIGLHELPRADEVDPSYLDLSKCVCQWDDPRWACDLERDTGLEEGERR